MSEPLRVLIVEDAEDDALLLVRQLKQAGFVLDWRRVETREAFLEALAQGTWHAVLADWTLPRFSGLEALKLLRERDAELPFLILSGTIGEEAAVAAMKAGANDFIRKGDRARLIPALERELRDADIRHARMAADHAHARAIEREQAARAETEALRRTDQLKNQFLGILSHELRTPLNAILGFGSVLEDEVQGPLSSRQHYTLGKILKAAENLLGLVDDLLDMSRIQAGKFSLSPAPMAFEDTAAEVVETLRPLAEVKRIRLDAALPEGLPVLSADRRRVAQVLVNLVGNAIKFTPADGKITVSARVSDGALVCEVTDTGPGIAPEDVSRLFQPFGQLDTSPTREAGGTGLGLSISKALVEAHGGHIGVLSQAGQGATFWFTLPLPDEAPAPEDARDRQDTAR